MDSLYLFQRIFLTQESNRGLLHCRRMPYPLCYQGSPEKWGSYACLIMWLGNRCTASQCMLSLVPLSLTPWAVVPTRLLCPCDFPGKNIRVDCHFLFQWIYPALGSHPHLLYLLHWPVGSLPTALKKEFTGPGLHLGPVRAGRLRPPLQWTLNSVLSARGNDNGRIRPPLGRGILKITSRLLIV